MIAVSFDALLLAPAALAVILSWSAVGKLRLTSSGRLDGLKELGGPSWLQRSWIVDVHPWAELLISILLLTTPAPFATIAAAAAFGLMAVYTLMVVSAYRRPEPASCTCFGGTPTEISRRTLARNTVLLGVAVVVLLDAITGRGFVSRLGEQGADGIAWLGGAAVLCALARLAMAPVPPDSADSWDLDGELDGPARLLVDPGLELIDEHGTGRRLVDLASTAPQLLLFGSFGCSACSAIYRDFRHFAALLPGIDVRYVVAVRPDDQELSDDVPVWRDPDGEVARSLQADERRPASVLVGVDGLTAGAAYGSNRVRAHVGTLVAQLAEIGS